MNRMLKISLIIPKYKEFTNVKKYFSTVLDIQSTIDDNEITYFSKMSDVWWNENGTFRLLHSYNPVRSQFMREGLVNVGHKEINKAFPLQGLNILDVGCGGGILSEYLAKLGGNVTGIDATGELIEIARRHAALDKSLSNCLEYYNTTIEEHLISNENYYDCVMASEVVEHVVNPDLFLKSCIDILKPGGSIFITTMNQTYAAYFVLILLTEYVFKSIPRGAHQWSKFIPLHKAKEILKKYGCEIQMVRGTCFNLMTDKWKFVKSTNLCYVIHAVKHK